MRSVIIATSSMLAAAWAVPATAQVKPATPSPAAPAAAAPLPMPGEPIWVASQAGAIPPGAQPSGYEPGGFLYTCRASVEGGIHTGKVRPGFEGCYVPVGGRETSVRAYEVMTGQVAWAVARDGVLPSGAVEAGRTRSGQVLYACRAAGAQGQLVPGKTGAGLRGCNIGVGGQETTAAMYEVLVRRE
jgi:hypothetical protein